MILVVSGLVYNKPMKVGFKTGPKSWQEGQQIITEHGAKYVELWYRYDWEDRYQDFFDFFAQQGVACGLHYWGVVDGNILPSFCYDEPNQYRQGIESVKVAIDAASRAGAYYVNAHPGSRVLTKLNDDFNQLSIIDGPITSEERGLQLLLEAAQELSAYAQSRGVHFLIETIPARDSSSWSDLGELRKEPIETHHASMSMIESIAERGILIANDFGHSAASQPNENRITMYHDLLAATQTLAPQTKLLHVNTVLPPFNGIDTHDGILVDDWAAGVFPNEVQFKELLQQFTRRPDVWAIPEPKEDKMLANYLALIDYVHELDLAD